MPLPRYQPATKRLKASEGPSGSADDRCLSKIIGAALSQSCLRNDEPANGSENQVSNSGNNDRWHEDTFADGYSTLVRSKALKGKTMYQLETNDSTLIEHLIKSADKICPNHVLKSFKLSTQLKNMDLFTKLMKSNKLGTSDLRISIDLSSLDLLREVRSAVEVFRKNRDPQAVCQLSLSVKDQKIPDCEDKIKNLVQICRLADVRVYVSSLQRISIDCCHLMWSTGRALQQQDTVNNNNNNKQGTCVFKINLKTYPLKQSTTNPSEITIPFGNNPEFTVDPKREDLAKHKDIMKSLKRDCYNQFVKSVRENNTPPPPTTTTT